MRTRLFAMFVCLLSGLAAAAPAEAQRRGNSNLATGENYHFEVMGAFWSPSPDVIISSEQFGQIGSNVDFVNVLGIEEAKFRQLKIVARPGLKHKFRFEYTPLHYESEKVIQAQFTFNGQLFKVGIPVKTDLEWKAYRFGYEWDFLYRSRGYAGLLVDLKYTDVQATLSSSAVGESQFTHARAPIPAIGAVGRGYVAPNISITGEFSFFKLPEKTLQTDDYSGKYFDYDFYGTINFNDHIGAMIGYRTWDVFYKVKKDTGTLHMNGPYFGVVGRF